MSSTPPISVSSGFAKLLATEDITVLVDSAAPTACFDVESRTLTMPVWPNMSEKLCDMLVGHEVSHALNTTDDDLPATVARLASDAGVPEQIAMMALNVVEDVRIDRLIQRRYPGLRRDYAAGYPEMREMNLFEVSEDENLDERSFLDRLNLHAKAYNGEVSFSEEEQILVDRAENTETYEEVLQLTADCLVLVKEQHDQEQNGNVEGGEEVGEGDNENASGSMPAPMMGEDGDESPESGSGSGGESGDETSDEESGDEGGESAGESVGDGSMESASDAEDDGTNAEGEETPGSHENNGDAGTGEVGEQDHTQELSDGWANQAADSLAAAEKNLENMAAKDDYERRHTSSMAPTTLGSEALRPITEVREIFASQTLHAPYVAQAEERMSGVRPTVNMMAMAFERKQAAAIDQRSQIAKSGDLDLDQLHNYKLTDDLFLRNEIQANGKNHAMTIVIDWSGSMRGKCESTMTQAVTFAMFCQKLNIPCEVFVFQSGVQDTFADGQFNQGAVNTQIIDTTARKNVFMNDCKNAMVLGIGHDARYNAVDGFSMGSTPLGPSLAISKFTHNDLMKRTGAEIGTIIFLTDGDGDCGLGWNNRGRETSTVVDPISKRTYTGTGRYATPIWDWVRGETGAKIINFFMCDKREGNRLLEWRTDGGSDAIKAAKKQFSKESWAEFGESHTKRTGWDAAFVVFDRAAVTWDGDMDPMAKLKVDASKVKVRNAWIQSLQDDRAARPLVERITGMIAV